MCTQNNKTILIIAHRLSTIEDSDIIYVINKGKIESFGSHSDLLIKSEIYKIIFSELRRLITQLLV